MRHSRLLFVLASIAQLQACSTHSTWRQLPMSTGVAPVVSPSAPVRVTRSDRSVIVLYSPRVVGDSLTGYIGTPPERMSMLLRDAQRIDVPSESVDRLQTTKNTVRGAGVVLGLVVLVMFLGLLHAYDSG